MNLYKANINRLTHFYGSDFFKYLKTNDPTYIAKLAEQLCPDPDHDDFSLYIALGQKFHLTAYRNTLIETVANHKIFLAADVICGRKQLMTIHPQFEMWIQDYESIRQNLNLHFIWPKHKLPTINTYRYTIYRDRMDYLLFDLQHYFQGEVTPMSRAYENETTKLWLTKFKHSFPNFIDSMQLQAFVDHDYQVLDIASRQQKRLHAFLSPTQLHLSIQPYLENLLWLIHQDKFN
ncbi:DUF6994 family protein [Pediococcus siamensis]|uniref:DUF6994 family protein n=1 Tax=Pediococcus siamensis TaxID=381829 RepID=UPI0039A15CC3